MMFRLGGSRGVRGAQFSLLVRRRGWASLGKNVPLSAEKYNVKRGQFAEVSRGRVSTDKCKSAAFPLLFTSEVAAWSRDVLVERSIELSLTVLTRTRTHAHAHAHISCR